MLRNGEGGARTPPGLNTPTCLEGGMSDENSTNETSRPKPVRFVFPKGASAEEIARLVKEFVEKHKAGKPAGDHDAGSGEPMP
jgi:hypothetical protein